MHHRTVRNDRHIAPSSRDARFASGHRFSRQSIGLQMIIEVFVLAEDYWIVDRDGFEQHAVRIFHGGWGHYDQPWIMGVQGLHALTVKWAAARSPSAGKSHGYWARHVR